MAKATITMTGQEFYDRFLKALGAPDEYEFDHATGTEDQYHLRKHVLFALRAVTGVDE